MQWNAGYNRQENKKVQFSWEEGCWYFPLIEVRRHKNTWLLVRWGKLMKECISVASGYLFIMYNDTSIINLMNADDSSPSSFLLSQQYDSIRQKKKKGIYESPVVN